MTIISLEMLYINFNASHFSDVEVIAKFAQLEFREGEAERGKTMFENVLSSYPKRTDLWSVYIDMVTKLGELQPVRCVCVTEGMCICASEYVGA